MAKLKIAHKESNGTLHDQRLTGSTVGASNYFGGVGGIPQWSTVTGVRTIKVAYRTAANVYHGNAYIIAQKGTSKFLVANAVGAVEGYTHSNASATICTLVNISDPVNVSTTGVTQLTAPSTMVITGYTNIINGSPAVPVAISRITSKRAYDFGDNGNPQAGTANRDNYNQFRYKHSSQIATASFGNIVAH
jgi:hypothetical protein